MTTWGAKFPLEDAFRGSDADRVYARYDWMSRWVSGPSVLDVGCSHGSLVRFIDGKNIEKYVGVDINPKALDFANKNYQRPWAAFTNLIPEKTFKTVVLGEVLEHQEDPLTLLNKASDHMDEDGILIITVPHGPDEVNDHRQIFSSSSFRQMLRQAGLGIKHIQFKHERILCVAYDGPDLVAIDFTEVEKNLMDKHQRMCRSYRLLELNYDAIRIVPFLKKLKKFRKPKKPQGYFDSFGNWIGAPEDNPDL